MVANYTHCLHCCYPAIVDGVCTVCGEPAVLPPRREPGPRFVVGHGTLTFQLGDQSFEVEADYKIELADDQRRPPRAR